MSELHHQQGKRLSRVWVYTGAVVALLALFELYRFVYYWSRSHPSSVTHVRSWLILIMVICVIALVAYFAELFVLALPAIKGLVNERRGRSGQAAKYYRQAVNCYLRGGYFPIRNSSRLVGIFLLFWKYGVLDLKPDAGLASIKDARCALDHLRRSVIMRLFLSDPSFQDWNDALILMEAAEDLGGTADDARAGQLARLEERLAAGGSHDLSLGQAQYELGHYEDASGYFDRAARGFEASGSTDLRELARVMGAFAAWEAGDLAGCEARLRAIRTKELDLRLTAIGIKCQLACAQGRPEKAAVILERIFLRVADTSVDAGVLALLLSSRATALRALRRYDEALYYARQAVDHLQDTGPTMTLDARVEVALALKGLGRHEDAVAVAANAAAELDACRYQLGVTDNRSAFARANEEARALALELATVSTPRLAAELIECARVQGLPPKPGCRSPAHGSLPPSLSSQAKPLARRPSPAPLTAENIEISAFRMAAGLAPLSPPPRLQLFASGDSDLAHLASGDLSAEQVVLAHVAEAVAGSEWWWWGSWAAGGQLYSSLIGHDGTVEAKATPMTSLEPVLARLAAALPNPLKGEKSGNVARARSGALGQPDTSAELARELGEMLIPPALKDLALAQAIRGQPLSLIVAPAPVLGRVPFGLLGLGRPGMYLAQGAVIRLGASAALLEQVRRRKPGKFDQRVLCVIDPCGKKVTEPTGKEKPLSLLKDGELKRMKAKGWGQTWLQGAAVLSRSGHLPELQDNGHFAELATIDQIGKMLRTSGARVFAYMGHVSEASDDAPTDASLVLDDEELPARDLLYDRDPRTWPMPPRVALIGCGSGGATAPEWLGLAPASLWAGAQIVAATSWDLIDEADTWMLADEIVSVLYRSTDPAAEWRERFIGHLADWESQTGPSPLSWGAIQFVGLHGS